MADSFRDKAGRAFKGMGNFFKRGLSSSFLPAFASATSLMIVADGKVEDSEVEGARDFFENDPTLAAWDTVVKAQAFEEAMTRAQKGIVAQSSLFGAIAKLKGKPEGETLLQLIAALAMVDGNVAQAEINMFKKIANSLGVTDIAPYNLTVGAV